MSTVKKRSFDLLIRLIQWLLIGPAYSQYTGGKSKGMDYGKKTK